MVTVQRMCDYCGCRESGPTKDLADEHVRLADLSDRLRAAAAAGSDDLPEIFHEFVHLLGMHAAKEEVGLFPQAAELGFLGDLLDDLVHEHAQLLEVLAAGLSGRTVEGAPRLLSLHIA